MSRGRTTSELAALALAVFAAACSDPVPAHGETSSTSSSTGGGGSSGSAGSSSGVGTSETSTGAADSGSSGETGDGPGPEAAPLCAGGLPLQYERTDVGDPVDADALALATTQYLDLLDEVRYFALARERVHGWPQSDPQGRYWFGTWWSGVTVVKQDGMVTYRHEDHGADNNGLRTGPLLEGVCYAAALWQRPEDLALARTMARGMVAWIRAMERMPDDPDGPMLCRAFYPEPITATDDGRTIAIDYALNRPGVDADPSEYVHVPANPDWGDVWIKNKRSKDDIGHMLRAIAQSSACMSLDSEPELAADFAELRARYSAWSRRVEDDGWRIATLDKDGARWLPDDLLAYFVDAECTSKLAIRLLGRFDAGELDCGNGIGPLDPAIIAANDHNGNILRSFHEAAANNALLAGQTALAQQLVDGIVVRLDQAVDGFEGVGDPVPHLGEADLVDMLAHAAALGVPLTSREVRWLHARIATALASCADPGLQPMLHVFDAATPDGEYGFEPGGSGINFVSLAALLGTCASPCANPSGRPVLDCDMVAARVPAE